MRMTLNSLISRQSDSNETQLQEDRQRYTTMTSESILEKTARSFNICLHMKL